VEEIAAECVYTVRVSRAAEHDFGEHRVKAIAHLDRAMREAEIRMSMR